MKWSVLPFWVAATAILLPLLGGVVYLRFAAECKGWLVLVFFLWLQSLTWLVRRLQALALARPGARLAVADATAVRPGAGPMLTPAVGLAAAVGALVAQVALVGSFYPTLRASNAYDALADARPALARYVLELMRWGLRIGCPLALVSVVNFAGLHGLSVGERRPSGALPPIPSAAAEGRLTLGEVHERDGSRRSRPGWLSIAERGMHTGILATGLPGTGKTEGCIYPLMRQLLAFGDDPATRRAGLVLDAKGDMLPRLKAICAEAGRLPDLYVVRTPEARINLIKRPDLCEPALAGYLTQAQENVQGRSFSESYWASAAQEFAMQALRALRLGTGVPPTLAALAGVVRSDAAFERLLDQARRRGDAGELQGDDHQELSSLERWVSDQLKPMAPQTKASIASNLSTMLSVFEVPELQRCFSPAPDEETFPGFAELIDQGKVVVLSMPDAIFKTVGRVVGTLVKLAFQDAVLTQLARARDPRPTFFVADEFDRFATVADSDFWARCRAARCTNLVAMQSYTSLAAAGIDGARARHFLAQLRTKLWLGADRFTAEAAAEECGREERPMPSRTVTENAHSTRFSFVDRMEIREGQAGSSASTSWHIQDRFRFPPERFTSLKTYEAIALPFDGDEPAPPTILYLTRDFSDRLESWFEWWARQK